VKSPVVVLDTSVIVAAARSKIGASSSLLIEWLDEDRFSLAVSPPLLFEYEALLRRQAPDTGWSDADVEKFLEFACSKSRLVEPWFRFRPAIRDADDEFVLELAFAAGVDYLVTLNGKDFVGSASFGVVVVRPGDLVELLREP
jgi:putative PIN family toxin of toxin-antitoxin system